MSAPNLDLETDPRFPSGPWTGYFLQPVLPGRHLMELQLTFRAGQISGAGRDWVGEFVLRGRYSVADGRCYWTKRYLGKHDVFYKGYNEGKGIWGVWEIPAGPDSSGWRGGFHIWPEGMLDPSQPQLSEEADLPVTVEEEVPEPVALPVGVTRAAQPNS
jgi:hypothetical protein